MDDKKVYSIVGKVEIGTDEYRELIEGLADAKVEASKCRTDYWTEHSKASKAEEELKKVTEQLKELKDFIKSDEAIETKLKLFRLQNIKEEEE